MEQSESAINLNEGAKEASKNLRTLSILSLIMGGLMILGCLWNLQKFYFPTENDIAQKQEQMEKLMEISPDSAEAINAMEADKGVDSIVGLITQVLSVIGVVLMLKLKKTGFYIYIAGELLPYVINIALKGFSGSMEALNALGGSFKALGVVMFVLMIGLDILFIVLYSRHTKQMS